LKKQFRLLDIWSREACWKSCYQGTISYLEHVGGIERSLLVEIAILSQIVWYALRTITFIHKAYADQSAIGCVPLARENEMIDVLYETYRWI
jgi:hypothetical protein